MLALPLPLRRLPKRLRHLLVKYFTATRVRSMPLLKRVAWFATGWVLISVLPSVETQIHGQSQIQVWTPQPLKANPWIPPNKPITKLAELRAKHAGEQNWTETVVDDN